MAIRFQYVSSAWTTPNTFPRRRASATPSSFLLKRLRKSRLLFTMKFERHSASRRVNAPGSVCGANRCPILSYFWLDVYRSSPCGSRSATPSRSNCSLTVLALKPIRSPTLASNSPCLSHRHISAPAQMMASHRTAAHLALAIGQREAVDSRPDHPQNLTVRVGMLCLVQYRRRQSWNWWRQWP